MSLVTVTRDVMEGRDAGGLLAVNDPLLQGLIASRTEDERRAAIEAVLTAHVLPVIHRIVQRQQSADRLMRAHDAEDIVSSVVVRLVHRLQRVPSDRAEAIDRLVDFAAASTFNAVNDFRRRNFPEHTRLTSRVRYVLARETHFRPFTSPAGPACALASWPETIDLGQPPESWHFDDRTRLADAVESLLRSAERPLLVTAVVRTLADAWNINDDRSSDADKLADRGPSQAGLLESRQRLAALWRETLALPGPQRTALLLNLRDVDGSSAIALFPLMGVASIDDVGAAIELPVVQLAKLWPRLPLDDLTIASLLGVTRQQVINLRLAARQRLARRLEKW
jgi:hypothetical protein